MVNDGGQQSNTEMMKACNIWLYHWKATYTSLIYAYVYVVPPTLLADQQTTRCDRQYISHYVHYTHSKFLFDGSHNLANEVEICIV